MAQYETPLPIYSFSPGTFISLGFEPVPIITVLVSYNFSRVVILNGWLEKSTDTTAAETNFAPKRSAYFSNA